MHEATKSAVNINLRLPRDLYEALRRASFETRESMTAIIVRTLQGSPEIQRWMKDIPGK